ncbi:MULTISPECIES: porin [unclassified Vibrio]|uniref:porin n=1 Tax=unclassified Vibrio TaxID=2614977 RepID=UPI001F33A40E|nr:MULTISPECIES: porin [unclassified Vibrio]QXL80210.1 Outer membrane protein YedS [Vibrio sp.]
MKFKKIAIVVSIAACGNNVIAAEIYKSDAETLSIGGHLTVGVGETGSNKDVEVHQVSPRINIEGKRDIGNDIIIDAKGEWALNYLDGGEESFKTRLGYIGATHDTYGRLVVGTQWSPYYDVAGVADMPLMFGNDFIYSNHGTLGTGRAEKMVSYRNKFSINESISIGLGAGWQGKHQESTAEYSARGQVALSASIDELTFGYAYNGGDIDQQKAESSIYSLSYGNFGKGIYVGLVYGDNENFYTPSGLSSALADSSQYEAVLAYGFDNSLTLSINYEEVEDEKTNKTQYSHSAFQAEYNLAPKLRGYAAYQLDLGDDNALTEDDDKWSIGVRYYL